MTDQHSGDDENPQAIPALEGLDGLDGGFNGDLNGDLNGGLSGFESPSQLMDPSAAPALEQPIDPALDPLANPGGDLLLPESFADSTLVPGAEAAPLEHEPLLIDPSHEASVPPHESELAAPTALAAPETAPLEKIKEFAENAGLAQSAQSVVPAALPFSLMIEGPLSDYEKSRLIDILSRENIGIREVDLEPQFAANRILIPRISEFAGILLVQALRGTQALLKLGLADEIFSTEDTRSSSVSPPDTIHVQTSSEQVASPAENLPVTAGASLPDQPRTEVLDTLTCTALLRSSAVETDASGEYQEMLERLKRELKFKAHHKGATGVIHFQSQLVPLSLSQGQYRIQVSGTAIRKV